jgi:hypothetical protein
MDDKLVTLGEYSTIYDAEFTRDVLQENGVKAMVVGDSLKDIMPVDGMVNVQIKVFAGDLTKAASIIQMQHDAENGED